MFAFFLLSLFPSWNGQSSLVGSNRFFFTTPSPWHTASALSFTFWKSLAGLEPLRHSSTATTSSTSTVVIWSGSKWMKLRQWWVLCSDFPAFFFWWLQWIHFTYCPVCVFVMNRFTQVDSFKPDFQVLSNSLESGFNTQNSTDSSFIEGARSVQIIFWWIYINQIAEWNLSMQN